MQKKTELRFLVVPMKGMSVREAALLAGDQVKKILPRRWSSRPTELKFLDSVERGEYRTPASLYAAWKAARGSIEKEYEKWENTGLLMKIWSAVKRGYHFVRGWLRRLIRRF